MTADAEPVPIYRLVEQQTGRELLTAVELTGFFQERPAESVRLLGSSLPAGPARRRLPDVELQVTDRAGHPIGGYYLGEVKVLRSTPSGVAGRTDLVVSLRGYHRPFPGAGAIWRHWATGPPARAGEWRDLPPERHRSWLHVAQTAWFQAGRSATRYSAAAEYLVEGRELAVPASFYCALGEAVNGPRGYFGSTLDGLADCLGQARSTGQFRLVWRDLDVSEQRLGGPLVASLVAVFEEFGVTVVR